MALDSRGLHPALVFALLFATLLVAHLPLLHLPYFWDEAGYYVPAARDLLQTGSLIPHSTPSNAHPPLVMLWLSLWWKLAGFAPVVTRIAMIAAASFTLLGVFCLAAEVANLEVAVATTLCTGLYPVVFAQSSLAHVDLAAAGFTLWGLRAYVRGRYLPAGLWLSAAAFTKETALLAPLALLAWEVVSRWFPAPLRPRDAGRFSYALSLPLSVLTLWYAYHFHRTGYVFGNPEYFRYNVAATLSPLRFVLALGLRLWQAFGYLNLYLLTAAGLLALWLPPRPANAAAPRGSMRPRIEPRVQMIFLVTLLAYVVALAVIGGAVLARYMLPVIPLVILVMVSTLWRRVENWRWVLAIILMAFVAGWFVNPPYGFSLEDNLAYRDYIGLHQRAEQFVEARYPMGRVLTAWPASDELSRPWLGYVTRPVQVVRIEDFSAQQIESAADLARSYDHALVFSTKYEPPRPWLDDWQWWVDLKTRFFGYHRDLPPEAVAGILGGRIIYRDARHGQWAAVIQVERIEEARRDLRTGSDQAIIK